MKKTIFFLMMGSLALLAFDGKSVYKQCAVCHGKQGEKVALKASPQLNTLSEEHLAARIKALLDGSSTISSKYLGMHQKKLKDVGADDAALLAQYILTLQ